MNGVFVTNVKNIIAIHSPSHKFLLIKRQSFSFTVSLAQSGDWVWA